MARKQKQVVIVEDEADILDVIAYNLRREGFTVTGCTDGEAGLRMIRNIRPDLVVLDLMLPGLDGIEICKELKADPITRDISVIMVTAKGEESDIVLGLGVGADDYLAKPFKPRELIARVNSVLRRGPMQDDVLDAGRVVHGPLVIDPVRHEVTLDGLPVVLTATQFRLLHFIASRPGRVFTREELLGHVVGDEVLVMERNIDVHIRALRKVLGGHSALIETIRGVGYRFADKADERGALN